MKKIFLTSGLILCMACPAFAVDANGHLQGGNANECTDPILGVDGTTGNDTASIEAVWNAISYDVTYLTGTHGTQTNQNGYTVANGATYDDSVTIADLNTAGISADTGYHFTGYSSNYVNTAGTINNPTYQPTDTINPYQMAGALTLTAQFAANTTTVTYSCGSDSTGGSAPLDGTATYASNFAFAGNTGNCAKAGYSFQGWRCTYGSNPETTLTMAAAYGTTGDHATDTLMAAGGTAASWLYEGAHQGTISCTAVYGANTINVNWYLDSNATTTFTTNTCTYDGAVTLPDPQPTKTGYTFNGYVVRPAQQNN